MALVNVTKEGAAKSVLIDTDDPEDVAAYIMVAFVEERHRKEVHKWMTYLIVAAEERGRIKAMNEIFGK